MQVRYSPGVRKDVGQIGQLRIRDAQARLIPLQDVADIHLEDGVYEIWRKDRRRRAMIQANVRGRDLASFVAEAQAQVREKVALPRSFSLEWGGTFENLQSATERLTIVVPVALAMIFLLLYATFQSIGLGLLIFLSVPLGAIGGVLENTIAAMEGLGASRANIIAAIGPLIRQQSYEVGAEFVARFSDGAPGNARFFIPSTRADHAMFDLAGYIRARLERAGILMIDDVGLDTYADERFFSYRRTTHRKEPDYGRNIHAIVLDG